MTKILIVDDEPRILLLMKSLLKANGFDVETAKDGPSALELVKGGEIQVVVTDLRMMPMDGMMLFKEIKAYNPSIPVVLLTAYASVETAIEAMKSGIFDYLTKPFKVDEMLACLKRAEERLAKNTAATSISASEPLRYRFENFIASSPAMNEVCETTINYLRDPEHDIFSTLPAPDFPTGGEIIYDRREMEAVYNTGRGGIKVRAKWRFLPKENIIEIYEIPYTATSEAIIDKVRELITSGKIKEINDMRDETDLSGLRLAIDLKRGTDPEKLMQKLFKLTPLQDSFACNFNILVAGNPRVMGVGEILEEWSAWRTECVRRRVYFDLKKKQEKLHLLKGLARILLDIDRAIDIIRNTELETDVVPNLMMGFGIDQTQAEFVAEIKLRNINREYILKRTAETEQLEKDIADLEDTLSSRRRIKNVIISELENINKKYPSPRKSTIIYSDALEEYDEEDSVEDYHVTLFLSKGGYFKKITDQSLRMSSEQKFKEDDSLNLSFESSNARELLIFTDAQQVYKCRVSDFEDTKASALGTYLPSKLSMDDGEKVITMIDPGDYKKTLIFFFENGKAARVELSAYETKTNRRKLMNAYSDKSPLVSIIVPEGETDVACRTSDDRMLVFNTSLLAVKSTKNSQGVAVVSLKKQRVLADAKLLAEVNIENVSRYRARAIPGAGKPIAAEDRGIEQLSLL